MTKEELIENQKAERSACSDAIKNSSAPKKVIIAGAGTGKTFTFSQVLRANGSVNNLAMTFINMLANDMGTSFGDIAEVKTFHAFCKKVLHAQNGKVTMNPYLTKIIEREFCCCWCRANRHRRKIPKTRRRWARRKVLS